MKRNSTRSYWLTNDNWFRFVNGKYELTEEAPPAAQRSFAEWHREPKVSWRKKLRRIRAMFY